MKFRKDEISYVPQKPGVDGMYEMMEAAARICYKTEDRIRDGSARRIVEDTIIPSGHTSVLEFGTVYLKFGVFMVGKWLKYLSDRYSRVKFHWSGMYVTTTYRTIMQGGYKDPIEAIRNKFDKDWRKDLEHWCEPTSHHHKRHCIRFVMDRVGSQSVMRHRGVYGISYAQESTRFVNYNRDRFDRSVTFSLPSKFYELLDQINNEKDIMENVREPISLNAMEWPLEEQLKFMRKCSPEWKTYENALKACEKAYMELTSAGWFPQDARGVLNLDVKTEFMMCAYPEDWDMWLFRRLDKHAHPHIQKIARTVNKYISTHKTENNVG